jgi:hypothetical protein
MEVKCGGAAVKSKRMLLDVSFQSMKRRGKMKRMMILKIKKKIN